MLDLTGTDKLSFKEVVKQLKFYELSVYIKISQQFSILVSKFVLSLPPSPLSLSLSAPISPAHVRVLLFGAFGVLFCSLGSPWDLVALFCPCSHPSSFGSCALGGVRAVFSSRVRGLPIFL